MKELRWKELCAKQERLRTQIQCWEITVHQREGENYKRFLQKYKNQLDQF